MTTILKAVCGSRAHGLDTPDSDFDFRSIYAAPTEEILKLGGHGGDTARVVQGADDQKPWEVRHFLDLATQSNPTILEVFKAPIDASLVKNGVDWGGELRGLFPFVWNSESVFRSHLGYSSEQHKKLFSHKEDMRLRPKFAVAYIRTLLQGIELLRSLDFSVRVRDEYIHVGLVQPRTHQRGDYRSWRSFLMEIKTTFNNPDSCITDGDVVNVARYLGKKIEEAYNENPNKKTDFEPINDYILRLRKAFWND